MTTLQSVFPFIPQQAWMSTINLQDAYFHIMIHPSSRRFLRFAVGDQHYQYKALPFGLSSSPRVFTKCMVVTAAHLRLQGIQVYQYIDDWLLLTESKARLLCHISITLDLLAQLGVVVNLRKSCLIHTILHQQNEISWQR